MPEPTDADIETAFALLRAPVSERHVSAGKAAFTWRTIDEELLALERVASPGVRSSSSGRYVADAAELRFEIETRAIGSGFELVVDVTPATDGEIDLLFPDKTELRVALTDGFAVTPPIEHPIARLRVTIAGRTWLTNWLTPSPG
ncbi:MAG: hypothetical protein AAGA37_12245 [Actinomycetota bacterium]